MSADLYCLSVAAVGATTTTSGSSQPFALPVNASAVAARYVRVCATGNVYIKFGTAIGVTVTTNDILIAANTPEVFNVNGFSHYAVLQETAAAKVNVSPVEAG